MTTGKLRGRAAQPLRPGLVLKAVLMGEIPLRLSMDDVGNFVSEAAITDIHSTYKVLTTHENMIRPKDRKLRGMTYASFITMFRFARYLGLVEKVREEPMLYPPPDPTKPLLSIRKPDDKPEIVGSRRAIYRLTSVGVEDQLAWTNLKRAWAEGWTVPQKVVEPLPPPPDVEPPVRPPVKPPPELKLIKLASTPSLTQFRKLHKHLEEIEALGITGRELTEELDRLSGMVGDWDMWTDDAIEDAIEADNKRKIKLYTRWKESIKEAVEGFLDDDFQKVKDAIGELV